MYRQFGRRIRAGYPPVDRIGRHRSANCTSAFHPQGFRCCQLLRPISAPSDSRSSPSAGLWRRISTPLPTTVGADEPLAGLSTARSVLVGCRPAADRECDSGAGVFDRFSSVVAIYDQVLSFLPIGSDRSGTDKLHSTIQKWACERPQILHLDFYKPPTQQHLSPMSS